MYFLADSHIYMYIYISIVIHRQICFVQSELISVARQYLPVAGIKTRLTQTPNQSLYIYIYITNGIDGVWYRDTHLPNMTLLNYSYKTIDLYDD